MPAPARHSRARGTTKSTSRPVAPADSPTIGGVEVDDRGRPGRILRELRRRPAARPAAARRRRRSRAGARASARSRASAGPLQHREHGVRAGVVELGHVARLGRRRPRRRSPTRSPGCAARSTPAPGRAGSPCASSSRRPAPALRRPRLFSGRSRSRWLGSAQLDLAWRIRISRRIPTACHESRAMWKADCASGRRSAPTGQARRTAQPRSRQSRPGAVSRKPWQAATS